MLYPLRHAALYAISMSVRRIRLHSVYDRLHQVSGEVGRPDEGIVVGQHYSTFNIVMGVANSRDNRGKRRRHQAMY